MNEQLHPLTLGEVLDRTAQLYRSQFLVYFGIGVIPAGTVLVFAAAAFVILAWAGSGTSAPGISATQSFQVILLLGIVSVLAVPVCLGVTALGWAAMTTAAARAFLGEPISIREAYRNAFKRGVHNVWLYLLQVLVVAAVPVTVFVLVTPITAAVALTGRSPTAALGAFAGGVVILLVVALAAFVLWMLLRVCLAFPASTVEQISAWSAIKRSSALSIGTKGRVFLLFLLGSALGWLLALALSFPVLLLLALIPGANNPQHAQMVGTIFVFIWYGLWFAVQAFTKPVYGIALTVFYFDQRIRTEGFDIEWLMQRAGMAPQVAPFSMEPETDLQPSALPKAGDPAQQ
jgi:hypothetical protein